ncbi:uncharacterized protein LOC142663727 [Rhinoderma darwinii]|uniref:uncharacterized protein LOC142663727 n=1 Tax=Rhinoderma darwinii TaxID=43563 RepID=UPI003F6691CD
MTLFLTDPPRMDKDRKHMAKRILNATLEIIYLLTGEDYIVVKKRTEEGEGWSRNQVPITMSPPHSRMNERNNEQKILDLTNKIIHLLTGEVPIRYQDVTVYFSMEEWEYFEGHKHLYKDIVMEDHRPLTSLEGSSMKNITKGLSTPLLTQNSPEKNPNVLQDHQAERLTYIKEEALIGDREMDVVVKGQFKEEEIPTNINPDDCTINLEEHLLLSPDYEVKYNNISEQEDSITSRLTSILHSRLLSTDPNNPKDPSSDQLQNAKQNANCREGKICSEGEKEFTTILHFSTHNRIHRNKGNFSCSECGKYLTQKSDLVRHQRIHTGEKPYSCSECGKYLTQKSDLVRHQKIHTGEKPYSCSECGKYFRHKSDLVKHKRVHTGEKPFLCSECGKDFAQKSNLIKHQRIHTGEKPFSCSECVKYFAQKAHLVEHRKTHTGEKLFHVQNVGNVLP